MEPRRTRIVATLGPASRSPELLDALNRAGVDVWRVNASHGDPRSIREDVARLRASARRTGCSPAVLLDLQGPKLRTGPAPGPVLLEPGSRVELVMDPELPASPGRLGCTYPELAGELEPGDRLLFDDGRLSATVESVERDARPPRLWLRVVDGGPLGAHKGINVPGRALSAPALTEKDRADLAAGVEAGVDWVALSFVRRPEDVDRLREELARLGRPGLPVCAKIEKPQALDHVEEILSRVDAIMVARGDLGVETPLERVVLEQKHLIRAARRRGVLAITATQMLESMREHPRPTRAEVADVTNAILDGTDALMLSAETAAGRYPLEAVRAMDAVARAAESSGLLPEPPLEELPHTPGLASTITRAACFAVRDSPRPLLVFTWSGATAIVASAARPRSPIFALTPNPETLARLSLAWGVTPVPIPAVRGADALIEAGERALLERGLVRPGQEVLVLTGRTPSRGATNTLTVERIGN